MSQSATTNPSIPARSRRHGIDTAFAFDVHFEQYGQFVRLPSP